MLLWALFLYMFYGYTFSAVKAVERASPWDVQVWESRSFGDRIVLIGESGGIQRAWAVKQKWGFFYTAKTSAALSPSAPSGELERTWATTGSDGDALRTMFAVRTDNPRIVKVIVTHDGNVEGGALEKGTTIFAEMDVVNGIGMTLASIPSEEVGSFNFHGVVADGQIVLSEA